MFGPKRIFRLVECLVAVIVVLTTDNVPFVWFSSLSGE